MNTKYLYNFVKNNISTSLLKTGRCFLFCIKQELLISRNAAPYLQLFSKSWAFPGGLVWYLHPQIKHAQDVVPAMNQQTSAARVHLYVVDLNVLQVFTARGQRQYNTCRHWSDTANMSPSTHTKIHPWTHPHTHTHSRKQVCTHPPTQTHAKSPTKSNPLIGLQKSEHFRHVQKKKKN